MLYSKKRVKQVKKTNQIPVDKRKDKHSSILSLVIYKNKKEEGKGYYHAQPQILITWVDISIAG